MENENWQKNWEKTTKIMNTTKGTITPRAKKSKSKRQRKDEKRAANSSFVENGVQVVEEVPSSSANSVAPSAATTPAAATAASVQEINVENEPGWISGINHNWCKSLG